MGWIFHDVYENETQARQYGEDVVSLGLTSGVKLIHDVQDKSYKLFIFSEEVNKI